MRWMKSTPDTTLENASPYYYQGRKKKKQVSQIAHFDYSSQG